MYLQTKIVCKAPVMNGIFELSFLNQVLSVYLQLQNDSTFLYSHLSHLKSQCQSWC